MDVASFLSSVDAFKSLSPQMASSLAERVSVAAFPRGTTIIRQGDPADCMYVIARGSVEVPVADERGQPSFVAQLGVGQLFGEMALLTGEPRRASVIATADCECVVVPREPLQELLRKFPAVASFLTEILGRRLLQAGGVRQVGKYKLVGELGRGSISIVYEGLHPTLERAVAVKMLSHALVYDETFAEGFSNEARLIASLRHPNIVEVYDTEKAYATLFIIMERVHGKDISQHLRQRRLDHDEVRSVVMQAASALGHAHERGIVHRDIKPSNILVTNEGRVKLMDFGLAVSSRAQQSGNTDGMTVGTPAYMAPEQALGQAVDGRADIYALGIVAYEMLVGQPPFLEQDPVAVMTHHVRDRVPAPSARTTGIPRDLDEFVVRATARDPGSRFQTCAAIADHFDGAGGASRGLAGRKCVKALRLSYSPERETEATLLLEEFKRRASELPGVSVE